MAEYHVRQRVLVRWERSKPGEHDVYAGRVLELYGEFGPRDRFTQMKALVQYELSDWRLWHKMAELSPLDEDADVAAPPDDDLCVADTKWQLFSTRCRYSFAPLTDPARCSACVHPSCCNYDALVTCLQSTRTCPIAGCNAANVRCRGIIRDDALRNSLAHLPPNTETFWLRGHAEIALQPPPTASSSALTTSDSSRQRPQLTIDGDASRRSSVRQRRAVELFAPGQGGGQKRRRVQQERPGGCAQGEAQPIIVDEDEEDGEEGEGEQEEQEEQEEAEAEAAGDGVVREACGMQLHLSSRNATGYCGVYRGHCGVGKITVTFQARRNGKYLGTWPTAVEAAVAYACAPESEEQSNAQQHIHMDDAGGHEHNSEVEHPPEEEEEPVAQRAKHVAEAQGKQAAAERSALAKDKKALNEREAALAQREAALAWQEESLARREGLFRSRCVAAASRAAGHGEGSTSVPGVTVGARVQVRWPDTNGSQSWYNGKVVETRTYSTGRQEHYVAYAGYNESDWWWHNFASTEFEWSVAAPPAASLLPAPQAEADGLQMEMIVCSDCTPITDKKVSYKTCYVEGGGFYCWDEEDCLRRRNEATSTARVRGSWKDKCS